MSNLDYYNRSNHNDWSQDDLSEYDDEIKTGKKKRSRLSHEQKIALLDSYLSTGGCYTMDQLSDLTGMSRATVYRYKDILIELNAPLACDEKNRYYYTDKTFRIPHLMTTGAQYKAAKEMKELLESMKGQPFYDEVKKVFDLLATAAPKTDEFGKEYDLEVSRDSSNPVRKIFLGAPCSDFSSEIWYIISDAMDKNRNISFYYINADGHIGHKTVQPWQLVFDAGNWNLWCWDYKTKETRMLTLTQMSQVEMTKDTFELPENYDLRNRTPGTFGAYVGEEVMSYKILFYKDAYITSRVVKRNWGWNQKIEIDDDGNTILSFDSDQYHPILTWVRSWGPSVKPLQPEQLVDQWESGLDEIWDQMEEDE